MNEAVHGRIQQHRARESGRGREANRPTEIPTTGWKDVLWRTYEEIGADRISTIAAGTTFFVLLALFPALAAFVSIYGLLADPGTIEGHIASLQGVLPGSALELIGGELRRLTAAQPDSLGLGAIVGILLALWSANSGVRSLFDALNVAYDETEKRSFVKLLIVSFAFTIGAVLFFILLINLVVGIPLVLNLLPLGPVGELLLTVLPPILLLGVAVLAVGLFYRYGPSRAQAKWRWITPGSFAAAIVWVIGSAAFSWYLSNFADYSATYGSLGAVVGLMMWIYISLFIVLAGAELNSELEHQTARDTTTGPERPLGQRDATMADRIGPAKV